MLCVFSQHRKSPLQNKNPDGSFYNDQASLFKCRHHESLWNSCQRFALEIKQSSTKFKELLYEKGMGYMCSMKKKKIQKREVIQKFCQILCTAVLGTAYHPLYCKDLCGVMWSNHWLKLGPIQTNHDCNTDTHHLNVINTIEVFVFFTIRNKRRMCYYQLLVENICLAFNNKYIILQDNSILF